MIGIDMKKGIFILLLLGQSAFAQTALETCLTQAEQYASPGGTTGLNANCYDEVFAAAEVKNKDISEDGNLEIFGHQKVVFTRYFDGTTTNKYFHSGEHTRLSEGIHHLHLDVTNHKIIGLVGNPKAVYSWKIRMGGNLIPSERINSGDLASATAVSLDEVNSHLIVIHQNSGTLTFYSQSACEDGKLPEHQIDIKRTLGGGATQMVSPVDAAVSASRNELYVLDSNLNKILVFASNASGDVAPLRSINVTGLGTLVKIDYKATADKLRVTDSTGTSAEFSP